MSPARSHRQPPPAARPDRTADAREKLFETTWPLWSCWTPPALPQPPPSTPKGPPGPKDAAPRTNTAIIARIFNYSAPRNVVGSCSMCFDPSNPPRALFFFYNPPRAPFFFFSLLAALQLHTRRPHPRPPTPPDTAAHKGQSQPPSGRVAESRPYIVRLRTLIAFLSTRGR